MVNLLITPTTLFHKKYYPKNIESITLWEHPHYFTSINYNKKKLILHRASMKYYYSKIKGYPKSYIEYNKELPKSLKDIVYFDPIDDSCHLPGEKLESPGFLLSKAQLSLYYDKKTIKNKPHKRIIFNNFYKFYKSHLNMPMHKSQDKHNRKKMPNIEIPPMPKLSKSTHLKEAINYVKKNFPNNYGSVLGFNYPINSKDANIILKHFVKNLFHNFGSYQDYISIDNGQKHTLFHTFLSSSLNIGIIVVSDVIDCLDKAKNIPLNSYEGLIRQYFWREYQRYCYVYKDIWCVSADKSFFGNKKKLSDKWYLGTTKCKPVNDAIIDGFQTGYLHHIRRLMVMANYMNLCGINPYEALRWFTEFAIDSYEWVMYQNVLEMGFFMSGGMTMRKPYITSSAYILKTSNYKRGEWCDVWDEKYKDFLAKHKKKLQPFRYHFPTLNK